MGFVRIGVAFVMIQVQWSVDLFQWLLSHSGEAGGEIHPIRWVGLGSGSGIRRV